MRLRRSFVLNCECFFTAPLRALSPTGLLTAYSDPLMRVGFLPFFEIRGRTCTLLLFFRWTLPRFIRLLGVLPIGTLTRIVGRFFFAHFARPATETSCSAPPCGIAPPGIDVTGLLTSITPALPSPATSKIAAMPTPAKITSVRVILLHSQGKTHGTMSDNLPSSEAGTKYYRQA